MTELDQAIAAFESGKLKDAERLCRAAVKREPERVEAWQLFGIVHFQRGNAKDAATCFRRAAELRPDYAEAHNNLGLALVETGRLDQAAEGFRRAIALRPDYLEAHNNLGIALKDLGRNEEAVVSYRRALALNPSSAQGHFNLGLAFAALSRHAEAAESFARVTALDPGDAEAFVNLGAAQAAARRFEEAVASQRRALALNPGNVDAHYNLGNALSALSLLEDAAASYRQALTLNPGHAKARHNLGATLTEMGRYREAIECYDALIKADAGDSAARGPLAFCCAALCDFERVDAEIGQIRKLIAKGGCIEPFNALALPLAASMRAQNTRRYAARFAQTALPATPAASAKLRVAYLSPDFRNHPVAGAIVELIERHDRARFEIVGVSLGRGDDTELHRRLVGAFDQFHDVTREDDPAVARRLRERGVHIAIDLAGHTHNGRPGIFAARAAPVQVNWLGFAGSTGIDAVDYILADRTALPVAAQPDYSEVIVHLPDSFFLNDSTRAISQTSPSRADAGLPEAGFVFCCFNQGYKFSRAAFSIWMQLLRAVEGSVLWLSAQQEQAVVNLRNAAQAAGIDPERIVFARRVPSPADHLARHQLADLFLDTWPYNAHATACDALFAGLPVLTFADSDFAGRVAASMLHAVGLPELVTDSPQAYQALALQLAAQPERLRAMRLALQEGRPALPLFDSDRFRRNIEAAYTTMWQRHQSGEKPAHFAVRTTD